MNNYLSGLAIALSMLTIGFNAGQHFPLRPYAAACGPECPCHVKPAKPRGAAPIGDAPPQETK